MFSVFIRRMMSVGWIGLALAIASPVAAQDGSRPRRMPCNTRPWWNAPGNPATPRDDPEECIDLALNRTSPSRIMATSPSSAGSSSIATLGVYDYQLDANIGYSKTERPVLGTLQRQYLRLDTTQSKDLNFGANSKYLRRAAASPSSPTTIG